MLIFTKKRGDKFKKLQVIAINKKINELHNRVLDDFDKSIIMAFYHLSDGNFIGERNGKVLSSYKDILKKYLMMKIILKTAS